MEEYLINLNAVRAAKVAGYSEKTAKEIPLKLLYSKSALLLKIVPVN